MNYLIEVIAILLTILYPVLFALLILLIPYPRKKKITSVNIKEMLKELPPSSGRNITSVSIPELLARLPA